MKAIRNGRVSRILAQTMALTVDAPRIFSTVSIHPRQPGVALLGVGAASALPQNPWRSRTAAGAPPGALLCHDRLVMMIVVLAGVSGSGKTAVGMVLAARLR